VSDLDTLAFSSKIVRDPVVFNALSISESEPGRPLFSLTRVGSVIVSTTVQRRADFDHSEVGSIFT
jgi:hypothetical protein